MAAVPPRIAPGRRRSRGIAGAARVGAGALLIAAALLGGCAQTGRPPVAERSPVFGARPDVYEVQPGDTLYSIAWRFGFDHQDLARANGIVPPYTILAGQRLRLREAAPGRAAPAARRNTPAQPPGRASPSTAPAAGAWQAPTAGTLARPFGNGNKGLDYRLTADDRVVAAAAGEVVYAGSGLGGYRHLVIVKHDSEYLSAYSFDRDLAVAEGQRIKAGALLADNVQVGRRPGTLHFEIRKDGDPVDPRVLIGTGS